MFQRKFLLYWACFLTIIPVIAPIQGGVLLFLPGIILMWFLYGCFWIGTLFGNKSYLNNDTYFLPEIKTSKFVPYIFVLAALIFFPLYIKFYTGNTLQLVILNIITGNSNYQLYQDYFADNNLGNLSIDKIPFIVINGLFKYIFISSVCRTLGFVKKPTRGDIILVAILVISTLFVSISRGTSFEYFELIMVFLFGFLVRRSRFFHRDWFNTKSLIYISIIGLLLIILFSINISLRLNEHSDLTPKISNELLYNNNDILIKVFPALSSISFQMAGYFSFGLFFASAALLRLNFDSLYGIVALFIPMGLSIFGVGKSYDDIMCGKIIDCSVLWKPDVLNYLYNFGFIGSVILIIGLGAFSKKLFIQMHKGSISATVLLYFVVISMISLPVGNFISASSSNVLSILIALLFFCFPSLNYFLFNYFKLDSSSKVLKSVVL